MGDRHFAVTSRLAVVTWRAASGRPSALPQGRPFWPDSNLSVGVHGRGRRFGLATFLDGAVGWWPTERWFDTHCRRDVRRGGGADRSCNRRRFVRGLIATDRRAKAFWTPSCLFLLPSTSLRTILRLTRERVRSGPSFDSAQDHPSTPPSRWPAMSAAAAKRRRSRMAPEVGLEPTTTRLTAACSTIELLWNTDPGLDLESPLISASRPRELIPSFGIHHTHNRSPIPRGA